MIDCLSNPDWLRPQIDFLLFLQNYRISYSDIIDKSFLSITVFGEYWLPTIICAITYWCIDFRAGIYLFGLEGLNVLISHFFKMLACVYRPWVLSDKIHPSELAIPFAKGYSFPSGHSAMSSSIYGGLAYILRQKKFICILLVCLVLLIMFSRLWLGVHTPQDVFGGLLIGLTLVFAFNSIINWAENNKNRYLYLTGIIDVLAIAALIYVTYFNNYRIDYVDGRILVDPLSTKYITCLVSGYALGLINGCFLCRRFFPFNPKEVSIKCRIIRGIIGSICVIFLLKYVLKHLVMNICAFKIATITTFLIGISVTLVYPMIFRLFEKSHSVQNNQ